MGTVQEYAFILLKEIYTDSGGDVEHLVDVEKIAKRLGLDKARARGAANYLDRQYLVEDCRIVGDLPTVMITASGIDAIEGALAHPRSPTQYFPAVYKIHIENMIGGAIQQGTHSSTQTVGNTSLSGVDVRRLGEELGKLRTALLREATSAEHHVAVGKIAEAEVAAKTGDGTTAAQSLSKLGNMGKWAVGIAEKIGVSAAGSTIARLIT